MSKPIIVTDYWSKPIPDRQFDWEARLEIFNGDDDQPVGHGATEAEAVVDLLHEAMEFDGDGAAQDMVIELAFRGAAVDDSREASNGSDS